jgi:DNA topoisomerase-1
VPDDAGAFDQTTIDVSAKGKNGVEYVFRATGSVLKFDGFLKVYQEGKDQVDEDDEEMKHRLPLVTEGEILKFKAIRPEQHFTEPPPRYNEATLVKRWSPMEWAPVHLRVDPFHHSGARVRQEGNQPLHAHRVGNGGDRPSARSFDDIFDVSYTARMEEELDDIEEGKIDWRKAMGDFYERFDHDLKHAEEHMTDIKRMEKPTDLTCEKCGKPLVVKWGKHGSFLACTGLSRISPLQLLHLYPRVDCRSAGSR